MKNRIIAGALVCLSLLLLVGCAPDGPNPEQVSAWYQSATQIVAQVDITADSGIEIDYTIAYEWVNDTGTLHILQPESLVGITATIAPDSYHLSFDEVGVETLMPAVIGFTPMDALHHTIVNLRTRVPDEWCTEKYQGQEALALSYRSEEAGYQTQKRVWLRREDFAILGAEYFLDNHLVLTLEVQSFQLY